MKVNKGLFKDEQKGDLIILHMKQKVKMKPTENVEEPTWGKNPGNRGP